MERVYLNGRDFCRGILLGLVSQDVTRIELLSNAGHSAARKTLTYLKQQDKGQFNYRFHIILSKSGESGDWTDAVTANYGSRLLRIWDDGEYEILVDSDDLGRWFRSQPGSPALWKDCAQHFLKEFHKGPSSR